MIRWPRPFSVPLRRFCSGPACPGVCSSDGHHHHTHDQLPTHGGTNERHLRELTAWFRPVVRPRVPGPHRGRNGIVGPAVRQRRPRARHDGSSARELAKGADTRSTGRLVPSGSHQPMPKLVETSPNRAGVPRPPTGRRSLHRWPVSGNRRVLGCRSRTTRKASTGRGVVLRRRFAGSGSCERAWRSGRHRTFRPRPSPHVP
jgi:hypothetical protein